MNQLSLQSPALAKLVTIIVNLKLLKCKMASSKHDRFGLALLIYLSDFYPSDSLSKDTWHLVLDQFYL